MAALEEAEAEFSGTSAANEAIRPPADALSRFSRALDAEAGPARAPRALGALRGCGSGFMAIPASVAWAAAAAARGARAGAGGDGARRPRRTDFEIAGTGRPANMPFALVTFKPDARIADIAAFLAGQGAVVISGPAAGGVFKIGVPAETAADYDRIVGLIAAQPFADTVLTGRKPDNGG